MKHFFKVFFITLISLGIIGSVGSKLYLGYHQKDPNTNVTSLSEKQGATDRVNVLLLGVDAPESDRKGDIPRSDTMMLLSLDPKTNTGFILSIPRDTRVVLPGRTNHTKINHAHRFGGPDLSIQAVKELLDIPIHHYVVVDYKALFEIVNDVGGIDINIEHKGGMHYDDNAIKPPLHIHFDQGIHHLDGQKAMEFLRYRKGYASGDLGRIEAQQKFISALLDELLSPSSITKLPKITEHAFQYIDTDMTKSEILQLSVSAMKLDSKNVIKDVLPGDGMYISGISYFIVDEPIYKEQIAYMMAGNYSDWVSNKFHERSTLDIADIRNSESKKDGKKSKHVEVKEIPEDINIYEEENKLEKLEKSEQKEDKNLKPDNNKSENNKSDANKPDANKPDNKSLIPDDTKTTPKPTDPIQIEPLPSEPVDLEKPKPEPAPADTTGTSSDLFSS